MFTKGQKVTFLQNWDCKGSVRILDLVVHSCGKKQMILVDEQGVKFSGCLFSPKEDQLAYSRVVSRLPPQDAEAMALEIGARIVADERAWAERAIVRHAYPETHAYTISMRQSIADLHEPRVVRG